VVPAGVAARTKGVLNTMFLNKLRSAALWWLAVGALGLGAGLWTPRAQAETPGEGGGGGAPKPAARGADKEADKKTDQDKLQGTWTLVSEESGGKRTGKDKLKKVEWVFEGDKYRVGGKVPWGRFKLDPGQNPKTIDLTDPKGREGFGIYKLEGDTLTVSHAKDERPAEFTTKEGGKNVVVVFKRVKP
jgi:uncharacterized protein (TIGR03067 family)